MAKVAIFKATDKDRAAIAEAMGPYFPRPIYGYVVGDADDGREVISLIEGPMYKSSDSDPKYCVLSPDGYQQETCHSFNFWTMAELKAEVYAARCDGVDGCDCASLAEDKVGVWPFALETQS